jgi:hypothetical protein
MKAHHRRGRKDDRAARDERGTCGDATNPHGENWCSKGRAKATCGGAALQARKDRHRSAKRRSFVQQLGEGMRRSVLLHAISRAAVTIGKRQIRVAEYRITARLNLFRNWGGASMRDYRRLVSAKRRITFYARLVGNFANDLNRPRL